jgi:hypothetical protein
MCWRRCTRFYDAISSKQWVQESAGLRRRVPSSCPLRISVVQATWKGISTLLTTLMTSSEWSKNWNLLRPQRVVFWCRSYECIHVGINSWVSTPIFARKDCPISTMYYVCSIASDTWKQIFPSRKKWILLRIDKVCWDHIMLLGHILCTHDTSHVTSLPF